MKQYFRPAVPASLLACLALVACGGGGGDGSEPLAAAMPSSLGVSPSAPAAPDATASSQSPSPSTLAVVSAVVAHMEAPSSAVDTSALASLQATPLPEQPSAKVMASTLAKLPLTREQLLAFNADFKLNHEAMPSGVPGGYDWYAKPKAASWNNVPSGFTALTGWGQAFWVKGTHAQSAYLLLKSQLTLVCHGSQREWTLLQASNVQGGVFQPDYANNNATQAQHPGVIESGAKAVGFPTVSAYHFWPTAARGILPNEPLCGVLTLVEARAHPLAPGSYDTPNMLIGMGGDYWLNKTAAWDNYKTNRDVAIGRLKLVTTSWAWYGLSTASDADLERLHTNGFALSR